MTAGEFGDDSITSIPFQVMFFAECCFDCECCWLSWNWINSFYV